jgi:hypothetical protein
MSRGGGACGPRRRRPRSLRHLALTLAAPAGRRGDRAAMATPVARPGSRVVVAAGARRRATPGLRMERQSLREPVPGDAEVVGQGVVAAVVAEAQPEGPDHVPAAPAVAELDPQRSPLPPWARDALAHMVRGAGEAEPIPERRILMTRRQTGRVVVFRPGSDPAASRNVRSGRTLVDVATVSATVPAGVDSR